MLKCGLYVNLFSTPDLVAEYNSILTDWWHINIVYFYSRIQRKDSEHQGAFQSKTTPEEEKRARGGWMCREDY